MHSIAVCELCLNKSPNGEKMAKVFMKKPSTSFFGCLVAAINPVQWVRAEAEQRRLWAANCMSWCQRVCKKDEMIIEPVEIAAIANLLDVDIAIQCMETARKIVYKAATVPLNQTKYYRTRPIIQLGKEAREGSDGWIDAYFLLASTAEERNLFTVERFNKAEEGPVAGGHSTQKRLREATIRDSKHLCLECGLKGLSPTGTPFHSEGCSL